MKFKNVVIGFVVLILLFSAGGWFMKRHYEQSISELRRILIESDSLRVVENGIYAKLVQEASAREIKSAAQNKELARIAEEQREAIRGYEKIVLQQNDIIFALQEGVVVEDSTGEFVVMEGRVPPYTVYDGRAYCSTGKWGLTIRRDPIILEMLLVQSKYGKIKKVYASTNDSNLIVKELTYKTVPEHKQFWKNLRAEAGVCYSKTFGPGLLVGLGYARWSGGIMLHEESLGFYGLKQF